MVVAQDGPYHAVMWYRPCGQFHRHRSHWHSSGLRSAAYSENRVGKGDWAAWTLFLFGIGYFIWGMWKGIRNKPHRHFHVHEDGSIHTHQHSHVQRAVHNHDHQPEENINLTPWILFIVFVLGPCEPLIPVLMYPAARHSLHGIVLVALVFSAVTIATMLTIVFLGRYGLNQLPVAKFDRWMHAAAGGAVALSGAAILFLGL